MPESGIYFKIFEKTQYLMNTLYAICWTADRQLILQVRARQPAIVPMGLCAKRQQLYFLRPCA